MIADEIKKKLWLWALISGVILGALFVVWAVFLNRGTIKINAQAPYTIAVDNLKSITCTTAECSTVVAPGDYSITLQKIGYQDETRKITVPINGEYRSEVQFRFIPAIRELETKKTATLPTGDELSKIGLTKETPAGYDSAGTAIAYLQRNPANFRQTLYLRKISADRSLGNPVLVTSFVRDLRSPQFIISDSLEKIAVIDETGGESDLYLVDLKAKSREILARYPLIGGVKWFPGEERILLEARAENEISTSLIVYDLKKQQASKLELKAPLQAVAIIDNDRIIAATNLISAPKEGGFQEGQLVEFDRNQIAADAANDAGTPVTNPVIFVDYSILSAQGRILKVADTSVMPDRIERGDGKNIYFTVNNKEYELRFAE